MKTRTKIIAGLLVAAGAGAAGAAIAKAMYYRKCCEQGIMIEATKNGISYYSNVIEVETSEDMSPSQTFEIELFTGGKFDSFAHKELTGAPNFKKAYILLPKAHSTSEIEKIGEYLKSELEYITRAGYVSFDNSETETASEEPHDNPEVKDDAAPEEIFIKD